ncbi:MAG: site-specific DNA-methyltransferase [Chloroflexi bacterium]|nr:site-specific DNA-methyltransferase [Chloroflexota bacterium]
MLETLLNRPVASDCLDYIPLLPDDSIHCMVSDIPYGISLDRWDVLHPNQNSALLGQSPAQVGKYGFKRRGKPIQGWSSKDRDIPRHYQQWCTTWADLLYPKLKDGASVFVFGARRTLHRAILALEDSGLLLKDVLAWEKPIAHYRAQRLSEILRRRGLSEEAAQWQGWRLGNLAPRWEPIAWFFKPYDYTITDNVLHNEVGAIHTAVCQVDGKNPSNVLRHWFERDEPRVHEAQKPLRLIEFLIQLTTCENHVVLDPFLGSGTTAVACQRLKRGFVGCDIDPANIERAWTRLGGHDTVATGD